MSLAAVSQVLAAVSDVLLASLPSYTDVFPADTRNLIKVPVGADPGPALLRHTHARLISFVAVSSSQLLTRLVPHLPQIYSTPTVLHVAVFNDISDVLLLRSALPFFLLSTTAQQAYDNAILASTLARQERKAVVHAFYLGDSQDSASLASVDAVRSLVTAEHPPSSTESSEDPLSQLFSSYQAAEKATASLTGRPTPPISLSGDANPTTLLLLVGRSSIPSLSFGGVGFATLSVLNPLPPSFILASIPSSVQRVVVVEQVHRWNTKWLPLYFELVSIFQNSDADTLPTIHSAVLGDTSSVQADDVSSFIDTVTSAPPSTRSILGAAPDQESSSVAPRVPKHESSYTRILDYIFSERLDIANSPDQVATQGDVATLPEFALGRVRGQLEKRAELARVVERLLRQTDLDEETHKLLTKWLAEKDAGARYPSSLAQDVINKLEGISSRSSEVDSSLALKSHFYPKSRWIIGSDAWSYDLGSSGLHHVIASGLNVNILILDTLPYSARHTAHPSQRKHDVGLYAMNHGDVYVSSVAVYSSYAHVLQALIEADRYNGPSVVLAYLPYNTEEDSALELLKETKLAVDSGYWPLYRWDPKKEEAGQEPFTLDSDSVKNDLRAFLDRQNHLSQLSRSKPELAADLVTSLGETVKEARKQRALSSFNSLVANLDVPPILILFASDNGQAEKVAKRLQNRAKLRGISASCASMNSLPLEALAQEEHVIFVLSTAGQGEPPQNGRKMFKAITAAAGSGEKPLAKVRYALFGMGDRNYWPRPEDAQYYNKPGKELDSRLEQAGGERSVELGLGDDQDADGYETGYKAWEPLVWKWLGVDNVKVTEAEPEVITNEHIKAASNYLRGTIAEGLVDESTGALAPSDGQLTKFHGIYEQDDRDIRDDRLAQGVEPAYSFMIRVRLPAGVCTPEQWRCIDEIADEWGNGTFKITTRQTFQFHGVIKKKLKPAVQAINKALLDTIAACGDVNRNVVCANIPTLSKLHAQVSECARSISMHLLPATAAYHEIWLDKKMVSGDALKEFVEPLYGEFYLPRKFKIAIAVPPYNDVDVFANDLGYIAIVDDKGDLTGFNVAVGGGMGVTHGNKKTYPRIATVLGFCTPDQVNIVAEKVMLVQRDNGNRKDRKNARLKYTIDRMGIDVFKAEVEKLLGYSFQPERPYELTHNVDNFGWVTGEDGRHHFTMFIENGRVQDEEGKNFKTGLRELSKIHKGSLRLTTNQHLIISDVNTEDLDTIKNILAEYKMDNLDFSALRLSSSACVAFPTCGLAMAESERYLPILIDKVEALLETSGLRNDAIVMRMTGCPNGCARPYVAEIAFVGKAPGTYSMLLGGGFYGQRMNKIYRESVTEKEILEILTPMLKRYALERQDGEHFGDWTIRAGYIAPTVSGLTWYDKMGGEGEYREVAVAA
ncbi:sulfite reductase subunit beta [Pterulicium gracile]|uniref:assimilatory sulfite reductase (NADPH) n=1 Tax=Pterulicium gracile TaxID=1884261 RepID=A0A5C3QK75_9AGAR|nr:sulfite reductase subunit beta [Pterula gracilis]